MPMPVYSSEISHKGLHKHRVIRGRERWEVNAKADAQLAAWDEQWEKKREAERAKARREAERERKLAHKEARKAEVAQITEEAQALQKTLESILESSLDTDPKIDWNRLLDLREFPEPVPSAPQLPYRPIQPELRLPPRLPSKPTAMRRFLEVMTLADKNQRLFKEEQAHERLTEAVKSTHRRKTEEYEQSLKEWNASVESLRTQHQEHVRAWEDRKHEFLAEQKEYNLKLSDIEVRYRGGDPDAVAEYCELVLLNSDYPELFPGNFDLQFNAENGILVLDFELPTPDRMPKVKNARYTVSRDEIQLTGYKPNEIRKLYDGLVYQTALRAIRELYAADKVEVIQSIVFNGRTESIDESTGQDASACIISVQTTRDDFCQIDLARVDPAKCIRKLRGVAATTLYELTPVAPVLAINREDSRFVESKEVITNIAGGDNLAAMDWEQFEHLVSELFEREFAAHGGEVRVTQASKDGGVDAIIFDPDPIRGGKFVVQAKRYTNVVPVAAVRDLYGTVVNEGAVKGILVTTAYYGPDSYTFAKDKPITLLDGSNLLSMLQNHGTQAHIDLKAARRVLESQGPSPAP
jgi:restriction system protein